MRTTLIIIALLLLLVFAVSLRRDLFIQTAPRLPVVDATLEGPPDAFIRLYADFDFQNPVYEVVGNSPQKIIISEQIRSVHIRGNRADLWMIDSFSPINNIYNMTEGQLRANGVMKKIVSTTGEEVKENLRDDINHFYLLANRDYPPHRHRPDAAY